ncbi:MAG TPA: helix-turn-helix transcriptional regulator [Sporichthyaceae bacterium]|jgi:transcriptional regulator with XRE-family HTH domain|nr:helix-turn-helix transcriptional regulator [Sporichthyaceae bacterium]
MALKGKRAAVNIAPPDPPVDLNEIVAYNFRRARELRGLTQDEAAIRLEPFLGQRLPQASISALERSWGGDKRREFDAQEILAFACGFDVPLVWFFLPPPGDARRLVGTSDQVNELYTLALGREDQLDDLYTRFRELGMSEPGAQDEALARVMGTPTRVTLQDYRHRRKELLLALLADYADRVDASADELGAFFDHLRQVGIRGLVAEQLNDPDYSVAPASTGRKAPAKSSVPRTAGS